MRSRSDNTNEFWKSASDLMAALIMVLMLVILLLVFYIIQIPDGHSSSHDGGKYTVEYGQGGKTEAHPAENRTEHDDDDSSGGGGGGEDGDDEGERGESEGVKSAVFVTIVDADTKKVIEEKGVKFQLYSDRNALQILNTYYPQKKAYKQYETAKNGTFYLPEKIWEDTYYMHQMSGIKGYEKSGKTKFTLDRSYDWNDPFVLKIPMHPKRDTIQIQMTDKDSGMAVSGAEFDVFAEEDITTRDGTVRCRKGEKAATIKCDENGYGKSKRLYLGKYVVRQSVIPQYYASSEGNLHAELSEESRKESKETKVKEVKAERTTITFTLSDELDGTPLRGVPFSVNGPMGTDELKTDSEGSIVIDTVEKNSEYEFIQLESSGDYIPMESPVKVKVSKDGRVGNDAKAAVSETNRLIRAHVGVKDAVLRNQIAEEGVALYAKGGRRVQSWTSNGAYTEISGIAPGKYYISLSSSDKKYPLEIRDTAEIQTKDIYIYTNKSYAAIAAATMALAALAYGAFRLIRRFRRNKAILSGNEES